MNQKMSGVFLLKNRKNFFAVFSLILVEKYDFQNEIIFGTKFYLDITRVAT